MTICIISSGLKLDIVAYQKRDELLVAVWSVQPED